MPTIPTTMSSPPPKMRPVNERPRCFFNVCKMPPRFLLTDSARGHQSMLLPMRRKSEKFIHTRNARPLM